MVTNGLRVYIETSVIGGFGRQRFHDTLLDFFEMFRKGIFIPVISSHTMEEVLHGNTPIEVINNLNTIEFSVYTISNDMYALVDKYMVKGFIHKKSRADALHIAIATVLQVDVMASWNMKHIVNSHTIPLFNKVNIDEGYHPIEIKKPEEIMKNE